MVQILKKRRRWRNAMDSSAVVFLVQKGRLGFRQNFSAKLSFEFSVRVLRQTSPKKNGAQNVQQKNPALHKHSSKIDDQVSCKPNHFLPMRAAKRTSKNDCFFNSQICTPLPTNFLRADFREGDEESNFSPCRVRQFTEWPGPLH